MAEPRPFEELRSSGLLWLINRAAFHPRGFALGLHVGPDGAVEGWSLLGDGSEPWVFEGDEDESFRAAEATLRAAAELEASQRRKGRSG